MYVVSLVATVVLQLSCFLVAFACQIDKITVRFQAKHATVYVFELGLQ